MCTCLEFWLVLSPLPNAEAFAFGSIFGESANPLWPHQASGFVLQFIAYIYPVLHAAIRVMERPVWVTGGGQISELILVMCIFRHAQNVHVLYPVDFFSGLRSYRLPFESFVVHNSGSCARTELAATINGKIHVRPRMVQSIYRPATQRPRLRLLQCAINLLPNPWSA